MNLHKLLLVNNDCYKSGRSITPRGVMIHSTGSNNPWLKRYVGPDDGQLGKNQYNNHWNMGGVGACVHAFIGKLDNGQIATYKTLPWNMRGWHCGSGVKGSGNDSHIGFEICEDGLADSAYFDKVYREAVELTAYLCGEYNLDPLADGVVICHCEGYKRGIASNHSDVMNWFPKHGKDMDMFRRDVNSLLKGVKPVDNDPDIYLLARARVSKYKGLVDEMLKSGFACKPIDADPDVQITIRVRVSKADAVIEKVIGMGFACKRLDLA